MVYIQTTKHKAVEVFSGKRNRNTGEPVYKPKAIIEYTSHMGGVDLSDQLMNYYNFLRRGCKWWRKLFIHLFNMVIMNAYIMNRTFGLKKKLTHFEYRYLLAAALLDFREVEHNLRAALPAIVGPNNVGHWPERLPKSTTTNKTKTRKCKLCFVSEKTARKENKIRNEKSTTIICKACRIPLCVEPCFEKYHEEMNNN